MNNLVDLIESFFVKLQKSYIKETNHLLMTTFKDLTHNDFNYLEMLYSLGKSTISNLASELGVSKPAVTQMINKLVKLGYVKKTQDQKDKRIYYIEVTDKFSKTYDEELEYLVSVLEQLEKSFTPEELNSIERLLVILNDKIDKYI